MKPYDRRGRGGTRPKGDSGAGPSWRAERMVKGLAMNNKTIRDRLFGHPARRRVRPGGERPANAESVMKQCGDDWKAAKAAGTTNGQTWQEFLKTCEAQKKARRPGRRRLRAAPAAAPRRPPAPAAAAPAPAPAPAAAPAPMKPAPMKPAPKGGRRADRRRPIRRRGRSQGALPERHRRLGQHQVAQVPLLRPPQLRHDQAGRLYVRSRRHRGRQRRRQGRRSRSDSRSAAAMAA